LFVVYREGGGVGFSVDYSAMMGRGAGPQGTTTSVMWPLASCGVASCLLCTEREVVVEVVWGLVVLTVL